MPKPFLCIFRDLHSHNSFPAFLGALSHCLEGFIFCSWLGSRSVSGIAFAVFCQQRIPRTKAFHSLECRSCFEATRTHFHCLWTRSTQDLMPHFSHLYNMGKTRKATFETLPFSFRLATFSSSRNSALLVFEVLGTTAPCQEHFSWHRLMMDRSIDSWILISFSNYYPRYLPE